MDEWNGMAGRRNRGLLSGKSFFNATGKVPMYTSGSPPQCRDQTRGILLIDCMDSTSVALHHARLHCPPDQKFFKKRHYTLVLKGHTLWPELSSRRSCGAQPDAGKAVFCGQHGLPPPSMEPPWQDITSMYTEGPHGIAGVGN